MKRRVSPPRTGVLRRVAWLALVVPGTLVPVAALLGAWALHASLPRLSGTHETTGLSAPVRVARDGLGVATVRGRTRLDVAVATGFVHAQERFFQMDLLRRLAAGELAALVGRAAVEQDRALRLHGLRQVAAAVRSGLAPRERELLAAYTRGVNSGLGALDVRPPEYLLLRSTPQPWRDEDTLLAVLAMFRRLSDPDADMDARRGRLYECLPPSVAAFLGGNDPTFAATLDGGSLGAAPLPPPGDLDLRRPGRTGGGVTRSLATVLAGDPGPGLGGSNAWAVAGRFTADGRALVANDMHLGLAMPNIWFRMRLVVTDTARPLDVIGVTLPGAPAVVAGSNGKVAWGFTNAYGDWSDRVLLEPDPADPERYRTPDGFRTLERRTETIQVAGADPVVLQVPVSVWGPVTRDWRGRAVAIRWLGHRPEAMNLAILRLEQVRSVREALDLGPGLGIPPQNLVAGDAGGHVGWTIAGRMPRRRPGYDPSRPHPGSLPDAGWDGWLPGAQYPRIEDPPDGRIWSANQHMVSGPALALIGDGGYWHGARARQIRDGLRALTGAGEGDMLALQLDDRALLHARWQQLFLRVLTVGAAAAHPAAERTVGLLRGWNGRASVDSVAYPLIRAFRMRTADLVFGAITAACRGDDPAFRLHGFRQREGALWTLVTERPLHLLHPAHRDWASLLDSIAIEVMAFAAQSGGAPGPRPWGDDNQAHLVHPLSRAVAALAPLLDTGPDPVPGDRHVPRVIGPRGSATERFAVRPGREDQGTFHMPGGQAGHFLSDYYRAGHRAWLDGDATPLLPGPDAYVLVLTPPGSGSRPAPP